MLTFLVDALVYLWHTITFSHEEVRFTYTPTVCLMIVGLNEADSLKRSLPRFLGSYPWMEMVIVDDGSTDGMADVAEEFARENAGIRVVSKPRGGKSSALNAALPMTTAEVIVILDADSGLDPLAIWEIVQPLADPTVGAVSGNVMVRNRNQNLLTRCQAFEYLRSILVGRIVNVRFGTLGIVSGAFGAFRLEVLKQIGGWDVGPAEDGDIVLRLRKMGYRIEFAPYAECYTDAPTSWKALTKQRRRWEWSVITLESRKHIDMAMPWTANFQFSNLALIVERWVYNLILPLVFWVYLIWLLGFHWHDDLPNIAVLYYFVYVALEFSQWLLILFYTNHFWRELTMFYMPLIVPFYQLYQRVVTTRAILEEMFTRQSYQDRWVPDHVRHSTWHW